MGDTAASATWIRFQTLTQQGTETFQKEYWAGWSAHASDIAKLVYERNGCVLTITLESNAIAAQIGNENRTTFPKPFPHPRKFEIQGSAKTPVLTTPDGEVTPEQLFEYLMNWLRDVAKSVSV